MNLVDACQLLNIRIFELNEENLKKKYRKACLKHHPDKKGDPKIFIQIGEAYEFLREIEENNMFRYIRKVLLSLYLHFNPIYYEFTPNLHHLLNKEVYYLKEYNLYVPLWHRELVFKNIVIHINPILPKNVTIDSDNNIHIHGASNSAVVKGKGIPIFNKNIYDYSVLSDIIYHA